MGTLDRITAASTRLNVSSDKAAELVRDIEGTLRRVGLGPVPITHPCPNTPYSLFWAKYGTVWRIILKNSKEAKPWSDWPREVRLATFTEMEKFLVLIAGAMEKMTVLVEKAEEHLKILPTVLKQSEGAANNA